MKAELKLQNRLKEARCEKGLSQSQLAKLVGVSRNTISSIDADSSSTVTYAIIEPFLVDLSRTEVITHASRTVIPSL